MDTIIKFGKKGKVKKAKAVEVQKLQDYGALAIDAKAALIQELIPLGLMHIVAVVEEEVVRLAGEKCPPTSVRSGWIKITVKYWLNCA